MLHSTFHHLETNEDPKTSTIFENLLLFPDNIFWQILYMSCAYNKVLPKAAGRLVEYHFWPHWDPTDTGNISYVEPDVFFRFEEFDLIIEAKYSDDKGQYMEEWAREFKAYLNEYGEEKHAVFIIAVGGSSNMKNETVTIEERGCLVLKCNWLSLLATVSQYKEELNNNKFIDFNGSAQKRIAENLILGFNLHGVYDFKWLESMRHKKSMISEESLNCLTNSFFIRPKENKYSFKDLSPCFISQESINILSLYGK